MNVYFLKKKKTKNKSYLDKTFFQLTLGATFALFISTCNLNCIINSYIDCAIGIIALIAQADP